MTRFFAASLISYASASNFIHGFKAEFEQSSCTLRIT